MLAEIRFADDKKWARGPLLVEHRNATIPQADNPPESPSQVGNSSKSNLIWATRRAKKWSSV